MKARLLISLCVVVHAVFGQSVEQNKFKIMFYNTENFFDCVDDSLTDDAEFNRGGVRGWNYERYQEKQRHLSRVIVSVGEWEVPAIVGLCEVENAKCVRDLVFYSPLKNLGYKFIHFESPDPRGIDVALLYQPDKFRPFHSEPIRIHFPFAPASRTRDVLFVSGKMPQGDTLHVFVCHFPSRLGGELESAEKRMFVALQVRLKVDSIMHQSPTAKIVIMGDFYDFPSDKSLCDGLKALSVPSNPDGAQLYNLMDAMQKKGLGTNKHAGEWGILDQLIVSGALLRSSAAVHTSQNKAHIFSPDFLLEDDKAYLGKQPFRTYNGIKYQGGYSDHLPVYLEINY